MIFKEHIRPESRMSDGFACGDGWFEIIDALCEMLQFDIDHNDAPQLVAKQVKEKLGTLRFHSFNRTDWQDGAISLAQSMSGRICEVCGNPGKTQLIDGFLASRCHNHSEPPY